MAGSFVSGINNAFAIAERFKTTLLFNLPADFDAHYLESVYSVSSDEVLALANKYYNPEDFCLAIGGGKE
jgi:zinc protease